MSVTSARLRRVRPLALLALVLAMATALLGGRASADAAAAGGYDNLAEASAAPVTVGGHKAYGVFIAPGTGYRNNNTNGIATGDSPEGMYAILDGSHYNGGCCFDYGNAETNSRDNGNGT